MSEYTRDEEYKIVDKLISKYKCRIKKNEEKPFTLFSAKDIGDIIKVSNIRSVIQFYPENMIKVHKLKTNGGEQECKFLTLNGVIRLLVRTRKPEANEFAINLGIQIERRKFTCTETDCIDYIMKAFYGENMIKQYNVNNLRIDLYFPDYKLAIECDEYNHKYRVDADKKRQENIESMIENCVFIRFHPEEKDFDIVHVVNRIFQHIKTYIQTKTL